MQLIQTSGFRVFVISQQKAPEKGDVSCAAYTTSVSTLPSGKPGPYLFFFGTSIPPLCRSRGLNWPLTTLQSSYVLNCAGKTAFIS